MISTARSLGARAPRLPAKLLPLLFLGMASISADASETGTVRGRVFNPSVQAYVRNAEVRIENSNLVTSTESDGSFTLNYVPVGEVTLTVAFSGYQTIRQTFAVARDEVSVREIALGAPGGTGASEEGVVHLSAFTVTSDREGNAKAVMEQKRNMNVTVSVGSEAFGDIVDGNVGEFLKFVPGVDVDYVESAARSPRLGGMDPQYVGVSFDGVKLASADGNRGGDLGRATSFDAFSVSAIESIEISRTTSSDMDADAPAGSITIKTRRAFDRKGRRIGYNVNLALNSQEFHLNETPGPGGKSTYKAKPNYTLEYSDVLFDRKFGFLASYNRVGTYTPHLYTNITHNRSPTTADPRPMVITAMSYKDGPFAVQKETAVLSLDWKATPRLVLAGTINYNYSMGQFFNRSFTFTAANNNNNAVNGRSTVLGDGLSEIRTSANGVANLLNGGDGSGSKITYTTTIVPKFEYKAGAVTVDGWLNYSRSFNQYDAIELGHLRIAQLNTLSSQFIATRSDPTSHEWTVQQTGGDDWFDLGNFKNPRIGNDGRHTKTVIHAGALNAQWATPLKRFPTVLKFGGKMTHEGRYHGSETAIYNWSYIGPGGNVLTGFNPTTGVPNITGTGSFAGFENPYFVSTGTSNIMTLLDRNGQDRPRAIPVPDPTRLAALFRERPDDFVNLTSPDNYYDANVAQKRRIQQIVTAGFGMADMRLSTRLQLRTGVRWEQTENIADEFDPKTSRETVAAGFPVNAAGRATTIPGINFQYLSNRRIERRKTYDSFFPMVSAKYSFTRNLQLHVGANKAIARPPMDSLTGAWLINEEQLLITSPNPNLLPEYSKNYAARFAWYFEPAGQLSVTLTQNNIRNLRQTRRGTAEEFGFGGDSEFANYEFQAPFNVANPRRHRNLEFAYSQTLPFKSEAWRAITVNTSYTRSYASARRSGLAPHRFTSGVGYGYKRFRGRAGLVWRDDTPETDYGRYRRHDTKIDLSGEYRVTRWASVFFQGRDIFNVGQTWMETPPGAFEGQGAALRRYESYGAHWNFGVKGSF